MFLHILSPSTNNHILFAYYDTWWVNFLITSLAIQMVKQRWQLYVPMHELAFLMEVALLSTTSMASSSCSFVQLLLEHAIDDPFVLFLFLVLLLVQGEGEHSFCQCLFGPCTTPLMRHIEHHVAPTPQNLVFKRWSPHIWGPQKVSFCPSQNHTKNTQS
jgi:hypothetical protein